MGTYVIRSSLGMTTAPTLGISEFTAVFKVDALCKKIKSLSVCFLLTFLS